MKVRLSRVLVPTLIVGLAALCPVQSAAITQQAADGALSIGRHHGAVTGTVLRPDSTPITHGRLRLRDIKDGRVVMGAESDSRGHYGFSSVPAGSYIVELVDENGRVLALAQTFEVAAGETVTASIRVGSALPGYPGLFGNTAAAALAAAAALGLTAVGNGAQPASARS